MATVTLQVPVGQIGWFEQMVHTMGWTFHREDNEVVEDKHPAITPAMRRQINKARKESAAGETVRCKNKAEMLQYFESL